MDFSRFPAVFFDLDGTIIDSAPGIIRSARYALQKFGRDQDPESLRAFIGPPLRNCFTDVCHLPDEYADEAVSHYRDRYGRIGKFECSLYPGTAELVRALSESGRKVILATSKPQKFAAEILEHFDIARYFTCIGGSTFDHTRTTKEEVIQYIFDSCPDVSPETSVMVGDRKFDIDGAKHFSMSSIGVLYGFGEREELEEAVPDGIADTVEMLSEMLGIKQEENR